VARAFKSFGFCCGALALFACGQASLSPPRGATHQDVETRMLAPKVQREMPRLIAPPPSYGNKVVMAQSAPHERAD
jgi:hypothetical protein